MRIDRIEVEAFGRLEGFDTGPDALGGLVVVLGPNEAGKSTLFSFLTTAFYGFSPATRERNPHVPWGEDQASGRIRVRLDGEGCADVERTLRSQPSCRLTVGGRTSEMRNQALPWVAHVPRTVFRQVFAITLGELAGLDEETWARVQDRMIGSMGASDLQSTRAVADRLEREAGEIWRPTRRGNQRLRDLQAGLRQLRGRRSGAQETDAQVRRLVDERETVRLDLARERELKQLAVGEVDRAQSLLPLRRQFARVATLRAEGGPRLDLDGLPSDPADRVEELEAACSELDGTLATIDRDVSERDEVLARAGSTTELLARREDVLSLVANVAGSASDRARTSELEADLADVEARLDVAEAAVLSRPWRSVDAALLASVDTESLARRVAGEGPKDGATEPGPTGRAALAAWAAAIAGVALLAWGLVLQQTVAAAIGAAALAAAAVWRWGTTSGADRVPPPVSSRGAADILRDIPVRPELLEPPDHALVSGLERLRELAGRHREVEVALEAARGRVLAVDRATRELARTLGRDTTTSTEVIARDFDHDIREAERLRDAAERAQGERVRLLRDRENASSRLDAARAELSQIFERAESLSPGMEVGAGVALLGERIDAHRRADQIEEELGRTYADLDRLRSQIEELDRDDRSWFVDDAALASAKARIEGHDERIEDLLRRGEALDAEVARLRELETVDSVDSEIVSLREEEARLVRERDRKWVVARLLREADRRFREEHQPDLVRRAGSYLNHLTDGRYERLVVDETHGEHLFHLVGPTLPAPVPLAPPVSTGTLEQAYLSLRLAIVDHLDRGGEKLPLFVDEVLVNWDGERRRRGLEVLAGISSTRQVFVFTCHPSVAAELEERGGRVLRLPS